MMRDLSKIAGKHAFGVDAVAIASRLRELAQAIEAGTTTVQAVVQSTEDSQDDFSTYNFNLKYVTPKGE